MEAFPLVVSDLHGNDRKFGQIVNHYGEDMHYVVNGDFVDGAIGTKRLMSMFDNLDTTLIRGNHELVLMAALLDENPETRESWQDLWLGTPDFSGYEHNTLESYGLERSEEPSETAIILRETMHKLGHLALLKQTQMYYETENLLVVHAGLNPVITWQDQRKYLDDIDANVSAGIFEEEPEQLRSFLLSKTVGTPKDLDKTLVTGHTHTNKSAEERRWPRNTRFPSRVFLASHLRGGAPAFAYESWSGRVKAFED